MKQEFIKKEGSQGLILFFGGWGSGPELFRGLRTAEDFDLMLCWDYSSMDFDPTPLGNYGRIRVIAWSMGVWVADRVLSQALPEVLPEAALEECIAVGGTLRPIDDAMGIPEAIFKGTLENMSAATLTKFRRRMCGKNLAQFMEQVPDRDADELKAELAALYQAIKDENSKEDEMRHLHWNMAVIGRQDLIFPADNQKTAWSDAGLCMADAIMFADAPHYDKDLFESLLIQ